LKAYPETRMFGCLPSYGFYCRHVTGLRLRNLEIHAVDREARPALVCDDVKDLDVDGLEVSAAISGQPAVKLVQTQKAWIRNCSGPAGTKAFVALDRGSTEDVAITNCNLRGVQEVQLGPGVSRKAYCVPGISKRRPDGPPEPQFYRPLACRQTLSAKLGN
jgi:hypothetical protein